MKQCNAKRHKDDRKIRKLKKVKSTNEKSILELKLDLKHEKDENAKYQTKIGNYENQFERICPAWSEWTDCSKPCRGGIQTRINKCSNDEETRSCNEDVLCPKSGEL